MKNAATGIGMCAIGLGLASIGFNLNGNTATATPAAFNAGLGERTIVWYNSHATNGWAPSTSPRADLVLVRAWSDGTIEARWVRPTVDNDNCVGVVDPSQCEDTRGWFVVNDPSDGMRLAGDIDGNGEVSGSDLGILLNEFGLSEPGTFTPSDCPLGLIP